MNVYRQPPPVRLRPLSMTVFEQPAAPPEFPAECFERTEPLQRRESPPPRLRAVAFTEGSAAPPPEWPTELYRKASPVARAPREPVRAAPAGSAVFDDTTLIVIPDPPVPQALRYREPNRAGQPRVTLASLLYVAPVQPFPPELFHGVSARAPAPGPALRVRAPTVLEEPAVPPAFPGELLRTVAPAQRREGPAPRGAAVFITEGAPVAPETYPPELFGRRQGARVQPGQPPRLTARFVIEPAVEAYVPLAALARPQRDLPTQVRLARVQITDSAPVLPPDPPPLRRFDQAPHRIPGWRPHRTWPTSTVYEVVLTPELSVRVTFDMRSEVATSVFEPRIDLDDGRFHANAGIERSTFEPNP